MVTTVSPALSDETAKDLDNDTLAANPENSRFGFVGMDQGWDELVEMGFGWDRPHPGPANWDEIEPSKGQYDWQCIDRYVLTAQSYGVQILFTIWPFADWDQLSCHSGAPQINDEFSRELGLRRGLPCDTVAYQAFVRALVERYDGDGNDDMPGLLYPVTYWEVSNEPEMTEPPLVFFQGTPADYVELLRLSSEAIRETDPQAKVVQGGAAGADLFMTDFWEEAFSLGAAQYFDISNVHSINGPEDLWTENWAALMERYDISKPYWVTEVQIGSDLGFKGMSEDEQAEMIVKGFAQAFGNGAEKAFYTFYRADRFMPTDMAGATLIDASGRKKPAFFAMQTLIEKLGCFDSAEKLGQTSYKFWANNSTIYVLWGSCALPSDVIGQIIVTDIYGKENIKSADDFVMSNSPVFIEMEAD
jgi:hypothetical protein